MKFLFAVLAVIAVVVFSFVSTGNRLVALDEDVNSKWAQVQNVYQRRFDLVPNLVQTVKGYAKHEADVLKSVTEARSRVGQVSLKGGPDDLKKFEESQASLSSALSRLLVVSENYPALKADRNFLELQSQLEGTENRISVERGRFNEAARAYNSAIRSFPQSFVASMRGLKQRAYFEGQTEAATAPKVEF